MLGGEDAWKNVDSTDGNFANALKLFYLIFYIITAIFINVRY